jgi:hypothetical protein
MVLLMAPAGVDPLELRKTHAWIDSRDEDGGSGSGSSSERSSEGGSRASGSPAAGEDEADGGTPTPGRQRLSKILERVRSRRKRGHGSGAGASNGGGEVALAAVESGRSAAGKEAAAAAAVSGVGLQPGHLTVVVPPEASSSGGPGAAAAASKGGPPASAFASTAEASALSSGSEPVRLAPVGIITLEDVMEELMQVGLHGFSVQSILLRPSHQPPSAGGLLGCAAGGERAPSVLQSSCPPCGP